MVSAATDAAVIASISTPVRSNALTDAFTRIDPVAGSGSNSTETDWRAIGWDRGIRSGVFFAAAIPARRATARTSPLAAFPSRIVANVSGFMFTVAPAVATRKVGSELFIIPHDPRRERRAAPVRKPLWAIFILSCACAFAAPALGVHLPPSAEQGEAIFQKNCSACHTVGGGRSAGPDLAGVTARRDRAWLVRIITAPGALLDSGDPVARKLLEEFRGLRMPDLGITPKETDAILSYLAEESASPATDAQTPPSPGGERPSAGGEPEVGKALFFGTTRFRNGGGAGGGRPANP